MIYCNYFKASIFIFFSSYVFFNILVFTGHVFRYIFFNKDILSILFGNRAKIEKFFNTMLNDMFLYIVFPIIYQ